MPTATNFRRDAGQARAEQEQRRRFGDGCRVRVHHHVVELKAGGDLWPEVNVVQIGERGVEGERHEAELAKGEHLRHRAKVPRFPQIPIGERFNVFLTQVTRQPFLSLHERATSIQPNTTRSRSAG